MIEFESAGDGAFLVSMRVRKADAPHPRDAALIRDLTLLFRVFNRRHFGDKLPEVPIRLTGRFHRTLANLREVDTDPSIVWFVFSRQYVERASSASIKDTLLHEMIHLWQHEQGQREYHNALFRAKARELGVDPHACEGSEP